MSRLDPTGRPVTVGAASVAAPGLIGVVRELHPSKGLARLSTARTLLETALARQQLTHERTIVLSGRPAPRRKGAAGRAESPATITLDVPDPGPNHGQVLLHTDEHGIVTWIVSPGAPSRERKARAMRTYVIPVRQQDTHTKGPAALVSKLLEVFVFPRLAPVLGGMADHFAALWEAENRPYGLRRFGPSEYTLPGTALTDAHLAQLSRGRVLLFIHGTFARAHTAFPTIPAAVMRTLDERYRSRVIAFDHFTITDDPLANAQRFIDALPRDATIDLDIIAHSRGGLVARALSEQGSRLELAGRDLRVGKVVFAGSPNAGCVLADAAAMGHLMDRYTNWLAWLPTPGGVDIFEGLLAVVKQLGVGVMAGLPGLQSMVPGGRFLAALNRGDAVGTSYFALASNYEPSDSNLSRFAHDALMDEIFQQENDLVVPTRGVWDGNGAGNFPVDSRQVFGPHDSVHHGGYFVHPIGEQKILAWLTG
jgi:hypothetical protein